MGNFMPYPKQSPIQNAVDVLSYTSFYIETFFNNTFIESATAFCYEKDNEIYLITNWHVLSGRETKPDKNGVYQPRNNGAIPNILKVWIYAWNHPDETYFGVGNCFIFKLFDEKDNPLFIEKKLNNNEYIDVALLKVNTTIFKLPDPDGRPLGKPVCVNNALYNKFKYKYNLHPSDDVFIIGYPFGKINNQRTVIWKRGSIASDLCESGIKFYIDTATRSGMSGSPIFRIMLDNLSYVQKTNKEILYSEPAYRIEFIGIYSGRIIDPVDISKHDGNKKIINDYDLTTAAQLGIAWKNEVIDMLFK